MKSNDGHQQFIELVQSPERLAQLLDVSQQHIDLCNRYGCKGLWEDQKKDSVSKKNDNVIYVDFSKRQVIK